MIELNEDSLQKAIQQLPHHRAADTVWEEIRWHQDKPLSAELPLHTAPARAWQGILASSVVSMPANMIRRVTLTALLLILIASILYPLLLTETAVNTNQPILNEQISSTSPGMADPTTQENAAVIMEYPEKNDSGDDSGLNIARKKSSVQETEISQSTIAAFAGDHTTLIYFLHSKGTGSVITSLPPINGTIRQRNDERPDGCSPFQDVRTSLFLLADYEPELFDHSSFSSPAHGFSLSSGYQYNRFRFTLGAGYNRIISNTQVNYEYRTNELVYSYNYVDSVYVDPITHETYYFTVNVDVYDSIDHTMNSKVTDRYSYLQIPFSVSYELAGFKKFALHLKLSGAYHLLQDNYRNYKPFYEASSRLVSTTLENRKLISDYWSAGGGVVFEYQASSRLEVNLTPGIKYNYIPLSGNSEKGLMSYGISFGLSYKIIPD